VVDQDGELRVRDAAVILERVGVDIGRTHSPASLREAVR
jgi:hypothetical protein